MTLKLYSDHCTGKTLNFKQLLGDFLHGYMKVNNLQYKYQPFLLSDFVNDMFKLFSDEDYFALQATFAIEFH
jgi:hypothetical protein